MTMLALLSIPIMRPKEARIRNLDMRVATMGPTLGPEMHMLRFDKYFSMVSPVGLFKLHCGNMRVIGIAKVRLGLSRFIGTRLVL